MAIGTAGRRGIEELTTEGRYAGFAQTVASALTTRTTGPSDISLQNEGKSYHAESRVTVPGTNGSSRWPSKGPETWPYCLSLRLL